MTPEFNSEREPTEEEKRKALELECLQDYATLTKRFNQETNCKPIPICESKICIKSHTTFVLHATIHGDNEM
jgi:hypothetical protein